MDLICDRCGQKIQKGDSWTRDTLERPFDPNDTIYPPDIVGGNARHVGECPKKDDLPMEKLEQAKNAILDAIIKTSDADLGSNAEAFASGYEALIRAETQERMIALATTPCDCHECKNDDFDEVIGEDA